MIKALVLAAALGLTVSGASACEFMRSAGSVDKTTVASVVNTEVATPAMSTPGATVPSAPAEQAAPADRDG